VQAQPMIAVTDVPTSSRWYQQLLGARSGHGGEEYEQIVDAGGRMLLQLHDWNVEEHPHFGDPQGRPYGNGVLLWFATDDFDAALARVRQLSAEILEGPFVNPYAHHREIWVRDPDGYVVVIAGPTVEV
jgi:catechol 2,3-dioxygenase-like lactoylglutathione lyase family enzyme